MIRDVTRMQPGHTINCVNNISMGVFVTLGWMTNQRYIADGTQKYGSSRIFHRLIHNGNERETTIH
jgi:hypothetical protein